MVVTLARQSPKCKGGHSTRVIISLTIDLKVEVVSLDE